MNDLSKRALAGLAKFQIALAAMIFGPAWSLAYWQGWLYWATFGASCLALSLYFLRHDPALVERRMRAGPGAEREPRQKLIMSIASVAIVSVYIVSALDHHFGWSSVPVVVVLAANTLVVAGFYGIFLTFRANAYAASTVRVDAGQRVVETGPYAIVRHPMYAAAIPLFLATPLALGSRWGLVPAAALIGSVVWRLIDEEAYLERNLPGYEDYRRKVRWRLVPGVW